MSGRFRWVVGLLLIASLGVTGSYAYNLGLARGVAQSAALAAAQGSGTPLPIWYGYGPWHGGFGFFPFAPLFFILFWLILLRGLFWRGRGWGGRGNDYHGGVPPMFDEWHRRAHAREGQPPPAGTQA
jgi:hypothetical protein